ncbi:sulfotransferase family protein [Nonomuraea sp. NPDC050404]|uniref:sulfotransferase family protein n=1 Tax=Nonomuraea sp. NPDC050404 TaxID=3155783 RepID=UPI00340DF379
MLTVIGAGLPRTGTSSMKAALERLGLGPCHHMFDIMTNPGRVERWLPLAEDTTQADWEHVFDGYRSCVDWPASFFWRELAQAYPEAKIVLTVRDPRAWHVSFKALIENGPRRGAPQDLPPQAAAFFESIGRMQPLLDRMTGELFGSGHTFTDGPVDEDSAVAAFERHVATVKESLPADRLLVFDVREGWEPLCRFLEVEVPEGEPFPHLNDSKFLQQAMASMVSGGSFTSPFAKHD